MLFYDKSLQIIKQLFNKFLTLEQYCVLCGCNCDHQICKECYLHLATLDNKAKAKCPKCLIYLPPQEIKCINCAEHHFYFDRIIAGFPYAFPLNRVLQQLKYYGKLEYSYLLSQLFWQSIAKHLTKLPDVIIPVPLHPNKHKLRGFNQVCELLTEFKQLNPEIPIINALRIKETLQQANLNRIKRINNLAMAFKLEQPLNNLHVAIVDDVVTTAATVNELAKLAKQLGAGQIDIWCLMRAQD